MSLFVNMSKFLVGYIARCAAVSSENTPACSGFLRWRNGYDRFCRRKSKQNFAHKSQESKSKQNHAMGVKRRRSAMRLRCDRKGLNSTSLLSGMRMARLFSINACQNQHKSQNDLVKKSSISKVYNQSVRTKCGRENCRDPCAYPECPPGNTRHDDGKSKIINIYEAYWETQNDDCCDDPCKWAFPRFDDIYLQESDKEKRVYTRTWAECPVRIKEKRVCCFDGAPPEFCKRPKKERPQTACRPEPEKCEGTDKKCQKLKLDCCCDVRVPQICKPLTRGLLKCKKFCTPYPSFSECQKQKLRPKRRIECGCLNEIPMCELWEYWRKRILSRSGEKC